METMQGIRKILRSRPVVEGAGVHLKRAFGFREAPLFDPFLMLDDFRSDNPGDYIEGFPFHPHRGIETITYVLRGSIEHEDSMGNRGVIRAGGVEWMTAGSGIIHQEMPKGDETGRMGGLQLWANLPASLKMTEPRYREIQSDRIPEVSLDNGGKIRVISGEIGGMHGPVQGVVTDPEYLDVTIPPDTEFGHSAKAGYTVFAYILEGEARFGREEDRLAGRPGMAGRSNPEESALTTAEHLILFNGGEQIEVTTGPSPVRFLLVSGKPIGEPIAWRGSVVMNTEQELETAFRELREGVFIRHKHA